MLCSIKIFSVALYFFAGGNYANKKHPSFIHGFAFSSSNKVATGSSCQLDRKDFFERIMSYTTIAGAPLVVFSPTEVVASGGATAGKYTTIPIAKRRYYGRVQQAVHEFLQMGPDVIRGDMTASSIQHFFDVTATVIVEGGKSTAISGQCTKKDGDCRGKEIRDSRYNDMKTSMYLLANSFRINQQKAPDNLPTVKAAKAFFREINAMEKLVVKKPKTKDTEAQQYYAKALDLLDAYLDLVELPPTDSGHYDQEFDTLVGRSARLL
mmetsp:Transcript_13616/g.19521  ORF Transcript_13616/g.19521 Transcript_13616/m.19521 type:complete len:266 (+) Transcript_13616:129-926(+)